MLFFVLLLLSFSGCSSSGNSPEVTLEKANLLQARGQFEDAIAGYTEAARKLSDNPDVFFNRGICYERLNLNDKALEDYSKCLELAPDYVDAINNRGVVLARVGKYKEAAEQFSALLTLLPNSVLAMRNRGLCYHDLGRFDEALADYQAALKLAPEDAETLFQRGNLYLEQTKLADAVTDYSKVIQIAPGHAKAWMNRGVTRYQQAQLEDALRDLEHAHTLDDNIVIPGLDWLQVGAITEVATAKPVLESGVSWNECLAYAMTQLTNRSFTQIKIVEEYDESACARLSATKDGQETEVIVSMAAEQSAAHVVIPAVDSAPASSRILMVVTAAEDLSAESDNVTILRYEENWTPPANSVTPVTSQLKL